MKFMIEAAFREIKNGLGANRVSVSNSCASELKRWYRLSSHVIENGIDTKVFSESDREDARDRLGIPQDGRAALFVGRPEWRKRPDIAITAARENGYTLYLAAGRPYEGMHWLGKLSPEQLSIAIAAVNVVLMPTQYEACSLAFLEALSVGTPVVTTDAGWVPDLLKAVPEYSALVSPINDTGRFTTALREADRNDHGISKASRFVRNNNSLEAFGKAWSEYIHGVHRAKDGEPNG
ncbi:glycosyltransferase family 4 protein [Arthrobacter bambusae]|nr:glycosyltransferase family 4 protein [Arthrobacter bambusae]